MLREHIEPAGAKVLPVSLALVHSVTRCGRFEEFEPVSRYEQGPACLVEPVIGPADALEQPARALGRAHLDHQVDISPVHSQIEAGSCHQRAQFSARHGAFNLAPRLFRQRAMVYPDGEVVLVHVPQVLEDVFGQETSVREDERCLVGADLFVELGDRPRGRMSAPRNTFFLGKQDLDLGGRAFLALDQLHRIQIAPRGQPFAKAFRLGDGGREGRALQVRRDCLEPGQCKRQQIAALAGGKGVHLVNDDAFQSGKQLETVRKR